jgi:hypothetical protein
MHFSVTNCNRLRFDECRKCQDSMNAISSFRLKHVSYLLTMRTEQETVAHIIYWWYKGDYVLSGGRKDGESRSVITGSSAEGRGQYRPFRSPSRLKAMDDKKNRGNAPVSRVEGIPENLTACWSPDSVRLHQSVADVVSNLNHRNSTRMNRPSELLPPRRQM